MKVPLGWDVYVAVNGQPEFVPGAVFWNGDEWTYESGAAYYDTYTDAGTMALNIIEGACGPGAKSVALVDATGSVYCNAFKADLEAAGHTVTRDTTPADGTGYDFVFCNLTTGWTGASNSAKCDTMWAFVQAGGGLYVGMGQAASEGSTMSGLLSHCGITYSASYVLGNPNGVNVNGAGAHWFDGVAEIGMNDAGQFSLSTPASGANGRWTCDNGGTAYYVLAAWWANV